MQTSELPEARNLKTITGVAETADGGSRELGVPSCDKTQLVIINNAVEINFQIV